MDRRLQEVYNKSPVISFDSSSRIVLMSDCHRGQGTEGDNFLKNQNLFLGALEYYDHRGFTYIELGDGDELWENRKIESITEAHSEAFGLMSRFYRENRFFMIYGNHDIVKQRPSFILKRCSQYYCYSRNSCVPLFPGIRVSEGLILENPCLKRRIFLVHGHQGSLLNDTLWPAARFLVRYFWRPLETVGFIAPVGAGRSNRTKDRIEKNLAEFAEKKGDILIAGHTHRPVFSHPGEGLYFNDGSCVHPRCVTAIEIENNQIRLVKWFISTRPDRTLYVEREVLSGAENLADY